MTSIIDIYAEKLRLQLLWSPKQFSLLAHASRVSELYLDGDPLHEKENINAPKTHFNPISRTTSGGGPGCIFGKTLKAFVPPSHI